MNMTTPADVIHLSLREKHSPLPLQKSVSPHVVCALPFCNQRTGIQRPLPTFDVNSRQQELIK